MKNLGMSYDNAYHKLIKKLLFTTLTINNFNICSKCNKDIENVDDLDICHRLSWLDSDNPKELFFDVNNVVFNHMDCK